jgi:hypothetical protein
VNAYPEKPSPALTLKIIESSNIKRSGYAMKMSITQALAELKLLDARIHKSLDRGNSGFVFCVGYMTGTKINSTMTPEEAESVVKSNWQSVNDLIKRRADIKSKIVASNAATEVEVGGVKMTVAEAIERKSSIKYEQAMLNTLKDDFRRAAAAITQDNEKARDKAQQSLDTVLGKEGSKTPSKEDIASIYDPVFQRYEWKFQDPIGIEKKIGELEKSIDDFLNNVDFTLSTSNALTTIEIE